MIGDRCDEAARVGVPGLGEHGCRGPLLDDPSCVHDGDPVRHLRHHREVVRHVDHGQPSLAPQPGDLLEHARLGHDVEPGGGLVEHDERRLADERDRDRDSLLLPAGELVRVALNELVGRRQVDAGQRRFHGPDLPVRGVLVEHVAYRPADAQRRVERGAGILRHVGDEPAPQLPGAATPGARRPARRRCRWRPRRCGRPARA